MSSGPQATTLRLHATALLRPLAATAGPHWLYSLTSFRVAASGSVACQSVGAPPEWLGILWAAFFPWVSDVLNEIGIENHIAGRSASAGEIVYSSVREV